MLTPESLEANLPVFFFFSETKYFLIPKLEIPLFLTKTLCHHFFKQLSHYRQTAETAQTDLAAEKVVSSGLQQEVRTTNTAKKAF